MRDERTSKDVCGEATNFPETVVVLLRLLIGLREEPIKFDELLFKIIKKISK